jgi:hypothetical protein
MPDVGSLTMEVEGYTAAATAAMDACEAIQAKSLSGQGKQCAQFRWCRAVLPLSFRRAQHNAGQLLGVSKFATTHQH